MGVEFEASEVHDPRQAGGVIDDHLFGGAARWERKCDGAKPGGAIGGRALLVERLGLSAVDEALENDGTILDALQRSRGHSEVVFHDIELRYLNLPGEVELFGMGDPYLASADRKDLRVFALWLSRSFRRSAGDWMLPTGHEPELNAAICP